MLKFRARRLRLLRPGSPPTPPGQSSKSRVTSGDINREQQQVLPEFSKLSISSDLGNGTEVACAKSTQRCETGLTTSEASKSGDVYVKSVMEQGRADPDITLAVDISSWTRAAAFISPSLRYSQCRFLPVMKQCPSFNSADHQRSGPINSCDVVALSWKQK